jgi:polysaccharide biosynthesis/export protein ExoF
MRSVSTSDQILRSSNLEVGTLDSVSVAAKVEQADLAEIFGKVPDPRASSMSCRWSARRYLLRPVKNLGSFKSVPGVTVLHVIAPAGGLDRDRAFSDPSQKIKAVREIEKRSGAIGSMPKLLARQAVLRAGCGGRARKIPPVLKLLPGNPARFEETASKPDRQRRQLNPIRVFAEPRTPGYRA